MQDYLRAVALLSTEDSAAVNTGDVSGYLGVAPASATEMLKKLAADGYVKFSPYHGTRLTRSGFREAQRITRKHRLLETFLSEVLHIPLDRVHSQACAMEHSLSDEAAESMCRLLNHPDRCPDDGQVIPACDLSFSDCGQCMRMETQGGPEPSPRRSVSLLPISSLRTGASGRVSFIRGEHTALSRLRAVGLAPGVKVRAMTQAAPDGRREVSIGGSKVSIDRDAAASVFVKVEAGAQE